MGDMEKTLREILGRLEALRISDPERSVFGAQSHHYRLNSPLQESTVEAFEERFEVALPQGYRRFLTTLGNGGAGPYYGLQPLENGVLIDLDYPRDDQLLDLTKPFPFSAPWNMKYEGDVYDEVTHTAFENEYFDPRWCDGVLRVSNYGCGVSLNLVVNGPEYGHIWVDSRGGDGGIFPDSFFGQSGRVTFLEWYQLWLDQCEDELKVRR